jgi:5'-3' exonuclease
MTDLVFDANSLYARSWFAAQRNNPDPREALRLAINSVLLLLNPGTNKIGLTFDRILFAWDGQQNKAKNRDPKPPAYHATKDRLKEILREILGAANVENDSAEGDDIVATVCAQKAPEDIVYIVSGDKDLMQLMSERCQYYSLHDKAVLSRATILKKFPNIKRPSQIALSLAVTGDSVDNIKGVHGYGEKKCRKLFEAVTPEMKFQEAMDTIVSQLPPTQADEFYVALERTLLRNDVPGVPSPAHLKLRKPAEVDKLDVPQIDLYYRQVYPYYSD